MARIFLAGASGAIGQRLAPLLVKAGHHVVGTTRTAGKAPLLRSLGVTPAVVDVFDAAALRRLAGCAADAGLRELMTEAYAMSTVVDIA